MLWPRGRYDDFGINLWEECKCESVHSPSTQPPPPWAPEALECFKQNLMGHSGGSLGNQASEMRVVKTVLMGVLKSIRTPTGNWAGGHLCCILAKNPCILLMF